MAAAAPIRSENIKIGFSGEISDSHETDFDIWEKRQKMFVLHFDYLCGDGFSNLNCSAVAWAISFEEVVLGWSIDLQS